MYVKTKIAFEVDGKLTPITGIPDLNQKTFHVITAWNPGDERLSKRDNDKANKKLFDLLETMNLTPIFAVGRDPDSDYFEESWAVNGLTDDEAKKIGADFRQEAIFRISDGTQAVLSCFEDWVVERVVD